MLIITEKHNTVRFGENVYFKVGIMINVPLLITIYLGRIQYVVQETKCREKDISYFKIWELHKQAGFTPFSTTV